MRSALSAPRAAGEQRQRGLRPAVGLLVMLALAGGAWWARAALRALPSIPAYALELSTPERPWAEGRAARVRRSELLAVTLRPMVAVTGPLRIASFASLVEEATAMRPWPVTPEALEGGGFLLRAPAGALLEVGSWRIGFRLSRPWIARPSALEELPTCGASPAESCRIEATLQVVPD